MDAFEDTVQAQRSRALLSEIANGATRQAFVRSGDIIWCPPGHKHWHGASPTVEVTQIAIQGFLDGKCVEWMRHVADEEYLAGPPNRE